MMAINPIKWIKLLLSIAIITASVYLCHQITVNSFANQNDKNDYAELNHIKYGLFNVEEWKRQLAVIVAAEINKLDFSTTNKKALRKHVETMLNKLIDEVDKKIRKSNSGSTEGWIKQSFINLFIDLEDIKKGIPEYTDTIIRQMTKSKTRGQIRTLLNKQLKQYFNQTFISEVPSRINPILLRTGSKDIASARITLGKLISDRHDLIVKEAFLLIFLSVILFILSGFSKHPLDPVQYLFLVLSLLLLLIAGVTTPMIDLEATICRMSFVLMGHPIHFENQVLYFQSKSILDVFWIMITHKDIPMKLVGVLLLTFSILFPVLKIFSSFLYYFQYRGARENPVIRFFVLKSGKWSMADVMVVAIFMAYIGFNGIITSQFGKLSSAGQELVILTTNGTCLQPGYFLFLAYTLLALFLSGFLTRKLHPSATANP